jgi:DNA-binding NarL/FixJ family response regulator
MSSGGLKVLLIDDSAVVRRILKRLLKGDSRVQHFFVAANAADGSSLFKISRPDAVVLDLVIILTNCDAPEMREECLRHGADSFLIKESDLLRVVSAIPALCGPVRARKRAGAKNGTKDYKARDFR